MFQMIFLQSQGFDQRGMIFMFGALAVMYFFLILPQRRKAKKEKEFRNDIKKGTKVVTTSGIHGKVAEINDTNNTVVIETGAGKIRFERAAISMELSQKLSQK
ncbi:preprotein translocase subunit YajC [uncultured Tenacibaculum sp.]|uniref:preprotein translocase subunit YajC n=2 Tax=Tenacibaculum TaxID=104267 RepID=UPI00104528E5|nr:preprotein translocase subunit YajC [uncultured Tenacibaculum sp.]TCI89952.1 preprotein translocase subunit YajC [Tenacibaculum sp. M341]